MEEKNVISLFQQKLITISGVDSVDNFSESQISLTVCGLKLQIFGTGLKVTNFSKTSGAFSASGLVYNIKYVSKKEKLSKRLFK